MEYRAPKVTSMVSKILHILHTFFILTFFQYLSSLSSIFCCCLGSHFHVLESTGDGYFICVVAEKEDDMVKIFPLKHENVVRFDPVKGCAILDFKPKSLGGGQLVVAPTDGGAFRFQVFDEKGKVIIHNLVVPSSQSAITFQANTIQLDSTTLKLPNSGAKITKTQAKSYKVWIATLEASFHEAMKSGGMESLLKEIVYTLWQCHKMHNWAFPAKRMVKVLTQWSKMVVNQGGVSICVNNPILANSLLYAATFCEGEDHQNLKTALRLYEMALAGYDDPQTLQEMGNLRRLVPLSTVLCNTGLAAKRAGEYDKAERYYLQGFEMETLRKPWRTSKKNKNMLVSASRNGSERSDVFVKNLQYLYGGHAEIRKGKLVMESSLVFQGQRSVQYRVSALRTMYKKMSDARPHIINPVVRADFAGLIANKANWGRGYQGGMYQQFQKQVVLAMEKYKTCDGKATPITWTLDPASVAIAEKGNDIVKPSQCEVCLKTVKAIMRCRYVSSWFSSGVFFEFL